MDGLNFDVSVTTARPVRAKKSHCVHGHLYTPENTILVSDGKRQCRTCRRMRARRWRFKVKLRGPVRLEFSLGTQRQESSASLPLVRQFFALADQKQITAAELVRQTGYNKQQFTSWRHGRNRPLLSAMVDCYNALGYDLVPVKRGQQ